VGIFLVAILLFSTMIPALVKAQELNYTNITVKQAKHMIKHTQNLVIIDVRNESEYNLGHLYNANLIPLDIVEWETNPRPLPTVPANDTILQDIYNRESARFKLWEHINDVIIIYCQIGARSELACQILIDQGFTNVYNMIGGITAWMEAGNRIYTTSYHATVDYINDDFVVDVNPFLLFQSQCTTCQNNNQSCSTVTNLPDENLTIIEETENSIMWLATQEINGTIIEFTINQTTVWHQDYSTGSINRTVTLLSTIYESEGNFSQKITLNSEIQHQEYNMTINTIIRPSDSQTYDSSITTIDYIPAGSKEIVTTELVNFTSSITLSQLYEGISKAVHEIGKEYKHSEDENLTVFHDRYKDIKRETRKLSIIVENDLSDYDKEILKSAAIIQDVQYPCVAQQIVCAILTGITCTVACLFSFSIACFFCIAYEPLIIEFGCAQIYGEYCSSDQSTAPRYPIDVWSETFGTGNVAYENNALGGGRDGQFAIITAPNTGDHGKLFVQFDDYGLGKIHFYGAGAASILYFYVHYGGDYQYAGSVYVTSETEYYGTYIGWPNYYDHGVIVGVYPCYAYIDSISAGR